MYLSNLIILYIIRHACNFISVTEQINHFDPLYEYCGVNYQKMELPVGMMLEKLIIIHRHGDRAPIRIIDREWKEKKCVVCNYDKDTRNINWCEETECSAGDITIKGYLQLQKLGNYVKNTYKKFFSNINFFDDIELRATEVKRTQASLFGFINGIATFKQLFDVYVPENDSMLAVGECPYISSVFSGFTTDTYSILREDEEEPEKLADNLWSHKCNSVSIKCNIMECDTDINREYLEANLHSWRLKSKIADKYEKMRKILFGRFANELKGVLENKKKFYVYSAHDNSINSILIGLSTQIYDRPPYASSIFIELWNKGLDDFVRIVYNNHPIKLKHENEILIPKKSFLQYLKKYSITDEEQKLLCLSK